MIEIGNNTLSSSVTLITSGSEMDSQLAEELKKKIEEVTEDKIEIDLLPPSLPPTTLPSSSYSFLIQQSISLIIDMNNVLNCHVSPPLPQGLILNRTTCTISGSLSSSYSSHHTITASSDQLTHIRPISIEIISSLISYPQTNFIIGQGLSFSLTPTLTKVSTISIVSGSLPIGLNLSPSNGVISGSPSQLLSSQSVTIKALSGTATETVVLSFTVITPITSFNYPQSYVLSKNNPFSITPSINGHDPSFSIVSGSLPIGLSFNASTGKISGIPSTPSDFIDVTIQASNQVGSIQTQLFFVVKSVSTLTIILVSLVVLLILIIIILILIIIILLSKKKKPSLRIKSLDEVMKHVKHSVNHSSTPQSHSDSTTVQSNIVVFDSTTSTISSNQLSLNSSSV